MKRLQLFAVFLVGVMLGGCCLGSSRPQVSVSQTTPDSDAWRSAVKLQVRTIANSAVLLASGFPIDKERIMTAGHFCVSAIEGQVVGILKDEVEIVFVNNNDEVVAMGGGSIETVDESMDLCVVKVPKHGVTPLEFASPDDVKIHDKVEIAGAPLGIFPTFTSGRVTVPKSEGWPVEDLNGRLVVSAPAVHGNSGGPILSEDGKVVGVVMAVHSGYHHIVLGVTLDTVAEYMQQEYGK